MISNTVENYTEKKIGKQGKHNRWEWWWWWWVVARLDDLDRPF